MKFKGQTEFLSNTNDQVEQNSGAFNKQKSIGLA